MSMWIVVREFFEHVEGAEDVLRCRQEQGYGERSRLKGRL